MHVRHMKKNKLCVGIFGSPLICNPIVQDNLSCICATLKLRAHSIETSLHTLQCTKLHCTRCSAQFKLAPDLNMHCTLAGTSQLAK